MKIGSIAFILFGVIILLSFCINIQALTVMGQENHGIQASRKSPSKGCKNSKKGKCSKAKEQVDDSGDNGYIHLPGKNCEDAPPCPNGSPCVMAPPHCNSGTCGTKPVPTCE